MMCEECGKAPAVVHVEKVVNGNKMVLNLCRECAEKKGVLDMFFQPSFSINNLLSALLGSQEPALPTLELGKEETRCPICGMSYRDFARAGRLGCSRCYSVFETRLEPLLRRIHGSDKHVGKAPSKAGETARVRKEIEELKKELSIAVSREAYEKAAELRDKIRELEKKMRGNPA